MLGLFMYLYLFSVLLLHFICGDLIVYFCILLMDSYLIVFFIIYVLILNTALFHMFIWALVLRNSSPAHRARAS